MNESHYCLECLRNSKKFLLSVAEKLPKLKAGYDKHKGGDKEIEFLAVIHKTAKHIKAELNAIVQALNELEEDAATAQRLSAAIDRFKWLDSDYEKLCGALTMFAKSLPTDGGINSAALGRLMNRVKMGYYPTDEKHVELIKSALVFPKSKTNFLDTCCGCGTALKILTDNENTATFGTEIDRARAETAQEKLDRVGYGSFFYSRISNRVFHCLFLNPPYLSVMKEGGGSRRAERAFLLESMCHLMLGGVLVYIIPFYRMTEDICTILAENFGEIKVYRFSESEFKKYRQIVIFGRLKERDDNVGDTADGLLRLSLNPDDITPITEIVKGVYQLPGKETEVRLFKGAEFNVNELAAQLKKSNSLKTLFEKSMIDSLHRNPLLPLKVAQIGLIGGSGLMNGLIECGEPHIIKGRIYKEKVATETYDKEKGVTEVREVTSNKMTFNLLTADGFKKLA